MARFFTDEQFPFQATFHLRSLGHDVLTVQEAGMANQKVPDTEVLAFAITTGRILLTLNRRDFIQLHSQHPDHSGMVVCTDDRNWENLATRIDEAVSAVANTEGVLIRVNRPAREK
ncbi:DUF5615 family PIN-like protein [Gloeobacter violaceus]|uniref:Gll2160 protein n=1 Tax=Gloeobacter violaceus (strain ATCC 29082 / PCC 7421) TaxID=251221 RepID=Q7NIM3_GLOVI|nr:DUF5615 family PIN-like protein [Gloeobacter violaceus]BAC90101.1 gll2160 [Gloeobacter violaceus PCC 7421]